MPCCLISCDACRQKNAVRNIAAFSEVEHKHITPATVFTMHAVTSLLYMFQWSMQVNKLIYGSEKSPIYMHPKHNKVVVTDIQEKPLNHWTPNGRRL